MGGIELERVGKTQSVPYRGAGRAEGRGTAARREAEHGGAESSREGMARERAESSAHTPSIADGTAELHMGEEVAATFRDTEDFSLRALCLCRYAPPAPYSPFFFFACLYLSVKKNVGTKRRPQDVRFTELLIGGKEKIAK